MNPRHPKILLVLFLALSCSPYLHTMDTKQKLSNSNSPQNNKLVVDALRVTSSHCPLNKYAITILRNGKEFANEFHEKNKKTLSLVLSETATIFTFKKAFLQEIQLQNLPDCVGNFTSLTELDLSFNLLKTIPEFIGNFTNLTKLDLSGNELKRLPESFEKLTNSTELNLSSNEFEKLPEFFGNLTNLTKLDLGSNQLKKIHPSISKLTNLIVFNLWNNQLEVFPPIGNLTNLTELDLDSNQLKKIHPSIAKLTKLTKLDLCDNPLKTLPDFVKKLKKTGTKIIH